MYIYTLPDPIPYEFRARYRLCSDFWSVGTWHTRHVGTQLAVYQVLNRGAYSYKFVGIFSCAQIGLRKARERELETTPDEKSTSNEIAEPYAR